ncbi:MAG: sigma-70 family RNA polymerase sigma factor [Actinomycetota bacterium]
MTPHTMLPPARDEYEQMVHQGMPLVSHIVRETLTRVPAHVSRDDLMSAGLAALAQAAKAYDDSKGAGFLSYAATRIRGAVIDELRGMDWASRSVRRRARRIDEVRETLAVKLGRTPSDAEVASDLGMSMEELAAHQDDVSRASIMSLQGFDDGAVDDMLPATTLTPEAVIERRERMSYLHDAVATLPERLRAVVEGYFFAERPMAEIAAELGVTESRVSQLRAEAVALLKDAINTALDPELVAPAARPNGCAARRREAYFAEVASHRSYVARLTAPGLETRTA